LKIENHISSEFNGKNIYQKFIIDRSKRTVFLITQAGELRQIIKAEYDKNLELIINTISEESRNVVKVKKKGIFSALLSIFN
jgi:fructosamine-3-kinase